MAKKKDEQPFDCCFAGYTGKKRFGVSHPDRAKRLVVAAPDVDAAMVAAAGYWKERWQEYRFYSYVVVTAL